MRFYRYLFNKMGELSPNEKLVYSALLYHSMSATSEYYDVDGNFDKLAVIAFIREHMEDEGIEYIEYHPLSINKLADQVEMTRITVRKIMDALKYKHHLFSGDTIICPVALVMKGYADFPSNGLGGRQLMLYLYLKDRSRLFHGSVGIWAESIRKDTGTTKKGVHDMLAVLEKKGLVERLSDGKLNIK